MARRVLVLALALACVAQVAAGCGGEDDEMGQPAGPAPAAQDPVAPKATSPDAAPEDEQPARAERARDKREDETRDETHERKEPTGERRSDSRRTRGRSARQVERVVRKVVRLISAADARVCRVFFTRHYAELVSNERGDAAFRRCESDIRRNKGTLEVLEFGEVEVKGNRALVRFKLQAPGAVTDQGWRLVYDDGDWLVDDKA